MIHTAAKAPAITAPAGQPPPAAAMRQIHPPTISNAVRLRMPPKIRIPR